MATRASAIPDPPLDDAQWRTAGDRIQTLLDASAAGGAAARERAEQLVCEVTDLYGAALLRMLELTVARDPQLADAFAADDLVASLLLVHGAHPHSVEQRISRALDEVRPYLGSHGGDVHLLEVAGDTVRLRFTGSCKSCPSSAVTLELAVEDAVRAAAPEVSAIEVVPAEPDPDNLIPAQALLTRVHTNGHRNGAWHPVPELAQLRRGEVGGFRVAGVELLACRVGEDVFGYHDRCPNCANSLAGAQLAGTVLSCPHCAAGFDVIHAGAGTDGSLHLKPVPVLTRDGVPAMAVAADEVPS